MHAVYQYTIKYLVSSDKLYGGVFTYRQNVCVFMFINKSSLNNIEVSKSRQVSKGHFRP